MAEVRVLIEKLDNGFLVGIYHGYSDIVDKMTFSTFCEAIEDVSRRMGQREFGATLKNSQLIVGAFGELCATALAPQLLALEAKVNPGIENLVEDSDLL